MRKQQLTTKNIKIILKLKNKTDSILEGSSAPGQQTFTHGVVSGRVSSRGTDEPEKRKVKMVMHAEMPPAIVTMHNLMLTKLDKNRLLLAILNMLK